MNDDMYLSLVTELYENGTWSKDVVIKRVTLYAKEKNLDMTAINDFLNRLTKTKEYTIDEKRNFLSVLRLNEEELKYGEAVTAMNSKMIEKFYEMEVASLDEDKVASYHDLAKLKSDIDGEEKQIEQVKESAPETENTVNEQVENNTNKQTGASINIEDIINGEYSTELLLGKSVEESDDMFNKLVAAVDNNSFNDVVSSLNAKMGPFYTKRFVEEWSKLNKNVSTNNSKENSSDNEEFVDTEDETLAQTQAKINQNKESETIVIPNVPFDVLGENMPETEEEFEKQAHNITSPESESSVEIVNASSERIEKLKKTKNKAINYFLKTAIVVAAVYLLHPVYSVGAIGGYLYFASEIKNGQFNPEKPVGKAVKKVVEAIMNIGMPKEEEKEKGGRAR